MGSLLFRLSFIKGIDPLEDPAGKSDILDFGALDDRPNLEITPTKKYWEIVLRKRYRLRYSDPS